MAKFNLDNYLVSDGLGFPKNFRRGNPNPLDNSSVWKTLEAAKNYAATDPTAYVGQILSVIEVDTDDAITSVMAYMIEDEVGTLKEVGSVPTGDDTSIEIVDGAIQIKGYGKEYYKFVPATETEEAKYELTEGFISGLEAKIVEVDGKLVIGWYEPNPTTVDGLNAEIATLKENLATAREDIATNAGNIDTVEAAIATLEGTHTTDKAALEALIQSNTDAIELKAAAEDVYIKSEVNTFIQEVKDYADGKDAAIQAAKDAADAAQGDVDSLTEVVNGISGQVDIIKGDYLTSANETSIKAYADEVAATAKSEAVQAIMGEAGIDAKYDTLKEVSDWILSDTTNSAQLITRVSNIEADYLKKADKDELAQEISELESFVGSLPEGAVSTNVIAYIKEVVDGLKIGDYAKAADLTALADRVSAIEADYLKAADKNELVDLINAKAAQSDLEALDARVVPVEEKLAGIEAGAEVNIVDSVSEEFTLVDRALGINSIAQEKISGLVNVAGNAITLEEALANKVDKNGTDRLMTLAEAAKLEKLVMDESGNVGISGTISAENVIGLVDLMDKKVDKVEGMGLSANNLTNELVEKINAAQVNVIDGVSEEFTIEDGKVLNIASIEMGKVVGLSDALAGKVDAVEGKGLSTNDLTDELLAKLNESQANVIEIVKVNGVALEVVDKAVDVVIPTATSDVLGVVMSSAAQNKVSVAEDGTMEVNNINVNKLVQTAGEVLVLNGGSSAI